MWKLILVLRLFLNYVGWPLFRRFANIFHRINNLILDFFWLLDWLARHLHTLFIGSYILLFFSIKPCLGSLTLRKSCWFYNGLWFLILFYHFIDLGLYFFLHLYSVNHLTIFLNWNRRLWKQDIFIMNNDFTLIFLIMVGLRYVSFVWITFPWNLEGYWIFFNNLYFLYLYNPFGRWFYFTFKRTYKISLILWPEQYFRFFIFLKSWLTFTLFAEGIIKLVLIILNFFLFFLLFYRIFNFYFWFLNLNRLLDDRHIIKDFLRFLCCWFNLYSVNDRFIFDHFGFRLRSWWWRLQWRLDGWFTIKLLYYFIKLEFLHHFFNI